MSSLPQYKGKTRQQYMSEWHNKYRAYWSTHDAYVETKSKICVYCEKEKPSVAFSKANTNKDGLQAYCIDCLKQWHIDDPTRQMLLNARARARRLGIEFALDAKDIVIPKVCPVLGIPLVVRSKGKNNSPSLDRKDNSKGYTSDNIRVISWRANDIKGNATVAELEKVLEYMKEA
jgi:hypothetical protein